MMGHGLGLNGKQNHGKPSDKAAGLQNNADEGPAVVGGDERLPIKVVGLPKVLSPIVDEINDAVKHFQKDGSASLGPAVKPKGSGCINSLSPVDVNNASPNVYGLYSDPVLIENKGPKHGSGFFDVSKQNFGLGPRQIVNTKNSFGSLCDTEDCFDTELGLWENEIEVVKKFVESNTRPKLEDYDSWSANMKKYYDGLTKMNEDDEVASETDETARFMKSGVK
ncbi:hypothetical protein HanOQP8_Chr10g0347951 [Helianthus annuus]|nr:hypothetical protein HanOQP8_Chr10g0347951 [Helianthus annuus]